MYIFNDDIQIITFVDYNWWLKGLDIQPNEQTNKKFNKSFQSCSGNE